MHFSNGKSEIDETYKKNVINDINTGQYSDLYLEDRKKYLNYLNDCLKSDIIKIEEFCK